MKKILWFVLIGIVLISFNGSVYATQNYYLPIFKPQPNYWSGFGITNLSTSNANVVVKIYNQNGSVLKTETKTITAKGQASFLVGTNLSSDGWIKVSSDQKLAGLSFLGQYDNNKTRSYMGDVPFIKTLSKSLLIPHVAQNASWDTTLCLANPNTSSATVTLTYTAKSGAASTPYTTSIPGNGSKEVSVTNIGNSTNIKGGYVTISSTQGLTAFALYNNLKTDDYSYAGINAVDISDSESDTITNKNLEGTWEVLAEGVSRSTYYATVTLSSNGNLSYIEYAYGSRYGSGIGSWSYTESTSFFDAKADGDLATGTISGNEDSFSVPGSLYGQSVVYQWTRL